MTKIVKFAEHIIKRNIYSFHTSTIQKIHPLVETWPSYARQNLSKIRRPCPSIGQFIDKSVSYAFAWRSTRLMSWSICPCLLSLFLPSSLYLTFRGVRYPIKESKGVFLVTTKNMFVPIERVYSVNTYSWISLSHKGLSEVNEQAHERSKWAKQALRCGASERSERSERCERTNVESDRVAR